MELVWLVYFISMLESIIPVLWSTVIASLMATVAMSIFHGSSHDFVSSSYNDAHRDSLIAANVAKDAASVKRIRNSIIVGIIATVALVIVPTTKTAYIMVGAYVAQKIVQDGGVQEIGNKVYQIVNNKLDSYLVVPK